MLWSGIPVKKMVNDGLVCINELTESYTANRVPSHPKQGRNHQDATH